MIAENLHSLRLSIAKAQAGAPLAAPEITLVAASKQQPLDALQAALAAGVTDFGENRVQEAEAKWPKLLAAHPQARLHLIGGLQSNKALEAVRLFHAIHSLDRPRLADALAEAMRKEGRRPDCYIQVNTGEEPQKSGVAVREAEALIAYCKGLELPLAGLMCVPPPQAHPAPHFALLREMARAQGLAGLSIGMSGDYETAIRMGATVVRIGTALFGARVK